MRNPLLLSLLLSVATVGAGHAQDVDVPAFSKTIEGNSLFAYPFSFNQCRTQILVEAPAFGTKRVLQNVSFRHDGGGTTNSFSATTLNPILRVYQVSAASDTMSTTWATNIGTATATVVFNRKLDLPAFSVKYPLPNPYTITIPFSQPFIRSTPSQNVLLDWQASDASYTFARYNIDAVTHPDATRTGSMTSRVFRNASCLSARGDKLTMSITRSTGVIGGPLDVNLTATPATGGKLDVSILLLGATNKLLGGSVPLPIALGSSFPNCSLAIDPLLSFPAGTIMLPDDATLAGTQLYFQGVAIDSTTLDVAISQDAWTIRILDKIPARQPYQSIFRSRWTTQLNQPTGFKSNGFFYAPTMRFQ